MKAPPTMSVANERAIDPARADAGGRFRPALRRGFRPGVVAAQAQVIGNAPDRPADFAPGMFDTVDRRIKKSVTAGSALRERVPRGKAQHNRSKNGDGCLHCSSIRQPLVRLNVCKPNSTIGSGGAFRKCDATVLRRLYACGACNACERGGISLPVLAQVPVAFRLSHFWPNSRRSGWDSARSASCPESWVRDRLA